MNRISTEEVCQTCRDPATQWDYDQLMYFCDRHVQQADFTVPLEDKGKTKNESSESMPPIFLKDVIADPSLLTRGLRRPSRDEVREAAEDALYAAMGAEIEQHPLGRGPLSRPKGEVDARKGGREAVSQCSKAFFYDGDFCILPPDHEGEHTDGYGLHWSDEACASLDSVVLLHGTCDSVWFSAYHRAQES